MQLPTSMLRNTAILCLLCAIGCSAKSQIDNAAIKVGDIAQTSAARFVEIHELAGSSEERFSSTGDSEGVGEQQKIRETAIYGQDEQQQIIVESSSIRTSLHGVEDVVPWWATLMGQVALAAIAIAVLVFLWRSGLFTLIRSFIWGLGFLIPKRSKREVDLDMKVLSPESRVTPRETVAAKRASDPAYAAAYDRAKRKKT